MTMPTLIHTPIPLSGFLNEKVEGRYHGHTHESLSHNTASLQTNLQRHLHEVLPDLFRMPARRHFSNVRL